MENHSQTTLWIVVVAVIALLLGCLGGAVLGGAAGYALGRSSVRPITPQPYEYRIEPAPRTPEPPTPPDRWPTPVLPSLSSGALVTQVVAESPAERAGIQVGDIITAVDGTPVEQTPLAEQIGRYAPGDLVTLTVLRAGREIEVGLRLGEHPDRPGRAWVGVYYQELPGGRFERPAP